MAKTYLDITNLVLQDANEVQLTEATFLSPKGIQAFAQQAVNRALTDIINYTQEWNWLKTGAVDSLNTVSTAADTQWYNFKTIAGNDTPYSTVDFDTFFVTDGSEVFKKLSHISYDEWHNNYREWDEDPADQGGQPHFVIETNDSNLFGLSPVPDDVYTVSFRSWNDANLLVNALDTIPFPERYYNTLVARARYYLWNFKENDYQANVAQNEYQQGLNRMLEQLTTPMGRKFRLV